MKYGPSWKYINRVVPLHVTCIKELKIKDKQIEKLTDTMQAQAIHIQSLITQKAIEAPGAKKPW